MAIAHVCIQCGWDLARVRPVRDPHYGLPLVICPQCHGTCVRRRHPIQQKWRAFLRLKTSLCAMFWHAVLLMLLLMFNVSTVVGLAEAAQGNRFSELLDERREVPVAFAVGLAVVLLITGTWLTAGLAHIRRWKVWMGWTVAVGLCSSIDIVEHLLGRWLGIDWLLASNPELTRVWLLRMGMLAIMTVIALAGIPLGHRLQSAYRRHRRYYWRKRRARIRRRRIAA